MKCSISHCGEEVVPYGKQCKEHLPRRSIVPRITVKMGHDQERARKRMFPDGYDKPDSNRPVAHNGLPFVFPVVVRDVRTHLLDSLAAAVGWDHAGVIVDALDMYLEVEPGDRLPALQSYHRLSPKPNVELDKVRKERDEAIARAEKAEQKLRAPKKGSK